MAKSKITYEFDEQDVRRGLLLRFEELYGNMGAVEDDFKFNIADSYDTFGEVGGGEFFPARIKSVTLELK